MRSINIGEIRPYSALGFPSSVASGYKSGHLGKDARPWRNYSVAHVRSAVRCRCLEVRFDGLLLGAELEEVFSHDHGFERVPCLDHVVLHQCGLAFFRRLWACC